MLRFSRSTSQPRKVAAWLTAGLLTAGLVPLGSGTAAAVSARNVQDGCPNQRVPDSGFTDISGNTHEANIECVAWYGVTSGKTATTYAPRDPVTRGQMASFLVRMLRDAGVDIPSNPPDAFDDDEGSPHEFNINVVADLEITGGSRDTNDVDNDGDTDELVYLPKKVVRRDQMASFLMRTAAVLDSSGSWEGRSASMSRHG